MITFLIIGVIVSIYLIISYILEGGKGIFYTLIFLGLPLTCIYFGDLMGSRLGFFSLLGLRPYITRTSPGYFVKFMGWVILLLPVIITIIVLAMRF